MKCTVEVHRNHRKRPFVSSISIPDDISDFDELSGYLVSLVSRLFTGDSEDYQDYLKVINCDSPNFEYDSSRKIYFHSQEESKEDLTVNISFELTDPKLISVNEQYMHPVRKCKNGRYTSYVCKSPYLKEVQSYYSDVLDNVILDSEVESVREFIDKDPKNSGLSLEIYLGIPESEIYDHDVSNFIKAFEDCLSRRLGVDDKFNLKVSISKEEVHGDVWKMKVRISTVHLQTYELVY